MSLSVSPPESVKVRIISSYPEALITGVIVNISVIGSIVAVNNTVFTSEILQTKSVPESSISFS